MFRAIRNAQEPLSSLKEWEQQKNVNDTHKWQSAFSPSIHQSRHLESALSALERAARIQSANMTQAAELVAAISQLAWSPASPSPPEATTDARHAATKCTNPKSNETI